jgi:hypothetical protein
MPAANSSSFLVLRPRQKGDNKIDRRLQALLGPAKRAIPAELATILLKAMIPVLTLVLTLMASSLLGRGGLKNRSRLSIAFLH